MSTNELIDPRVRLAISQWPEDAPRGAVATFCVEHGITRKSFYELRKRVKVEGPVDAPRPPPGRSTFDQPARPKQPIPTPIDLPGGTSVRKLTSADNFMLDRVHYMVGGQHGFQHILVVTDGDKITVTDLDGVILIEHTRPAPGVTYVGNGRPRGPRPKTANRHRSPETSTVTDVLRHHMSDFSALSHVAPTDGAIQDAEGAAQVCV